MSLFVAPSWTPLPAKRAARRGPSQGYEAAERTKQNRALWNKADNLSARSANSLDRRVALRQIARYEFANSAYCAGLVLTLAGDIIGTGPRLQSQLLGRDADNRIIEERWTEYAESIGLAENLNTAVQADVRDGETLCLLSGNPQITDGPQLDPLWLECDHLTTPLGAMPRDTRNWTDGIALDNRGRPASYQILRQHPGDMFFGVSSADYDVLPASSVIHLFRKDRPGQLRGVPQITQSLPIYAQLRRWTQATLTAAEIAADFAVLLTSQIGSGVLPDTEDEAAECGEAFSTTEIERGLMTQLPDGTDAKQMKSEHPNQAYEPFKHELLKESGRPVNAPFNVSAGDSSPYNFSSAKMDRGLYTTSIRCNRERYRRTCIERIFNEWYREGRMIDGYLPADLPDRLPRAWYWTGFDSIDPLKEANADHQRLADGQTTLQELLAEQGKDWEAHLRQRAREIGLMKELGIPLPTWAEEKPATPKPATPPDPNADNEDELQNVVQRVNRRAAALIANGRAA